MHGPTAVLLRLVTEGVGSEERNHVETGVDIDDAIIQSSSRLGWVLFGFLSTCINSIAYKSALFLRAASCSSTAVCTAVVSG